MKKHNHLFLKVGALALVAGLGWTSAAEAGGFALRQHSAYYQGTAFAGAAAGTGSASAMFWNPAAVTEVQGRRFEAHVTGVLTSSTVETQSATLPGGFPILPAASDSGNIGGFAFVPGTYTVVQITDDLYFANSNNAPFGLGSDQDDGWSGRFHGTESSLRTLTANPTVAYRFNDYLSVGVGLQIMYAFAKLENNTALTLPGLQSDAQLNGAGWGLGFNLGATIKPTSTTTIGIGFRSAVDLTLEGDIDNYNVRALGALGPGGPGLSVEAEAGITLPEMLTVSFVQELSEALRVMGTVEWTNWSRLDQLLIEAQGSGLPLTATNFNWDDGWYFALGAEYDATDKLTVRGGVGYEITPVPDSGRTVRITDANRVWLSAGLSYQATDRISIDAGYSHIFIEDGDINRANSNDVAMDGAVFIGEAVDQSVDLFSLSANIQLGGSPIFAGRADNNVYKP